MLLQGNGSIGLSIGRWWRLVAGGVLVVGGTKQRGWWRWMDAYGAGLIAAGTSNSRKQIDFCYKPAVVFRKARRMSDGSIGAK
jgi:hypothetical protein